MRRVVLRSSVFVPDARRLVKRNPQAAEALRVTLEQLTEDMNNPALRSHKLRGGLAGSWACSAGYDLRIVFTLVQHEGAEAVLLQSVGTHDEVY